MNVTQRIETKCEAKLEHLNRELLGVQTRIANGGDRIGLDHLAMMANSISREIENWTEIRRLNEISY